MFWNSAPQRQYGRFLKPTTLAADDVLIRADAGWDAFWNEMPDDDRLVAMTPAEMVTATGLDAPDFGRTVSEAIRHWRNSPSSSLINILGNAGLIEPGERLFPDINTQTQVLAAGIEGEAILQRSLNCILGDNRKPIRTATNANAMTAEGEAAAAVNRLARAFRIWEERNRALVRTGKVKLPKMLYRGIKSRDVALPDGFKADDGLVSNLRRCAIATAKAGELSAHKLADLSDTEILSFTSNEHIAEYFANNEGFVVSVDPTRLSPVAGWGTDEALAGADPVTGRQEREWIMRAGSHVLAPEDVRINDANYYFSTSDPKGIACVDGFVKAQYRLRDHYIEARFVWNASGNGGSIHFSANREWSEKRGAFKKKYGFDPLPSAADRVTDLEFIHYDRWDLKRSEPVKQWEPHNAVNRIRS